MKAHNFLIIQVSAVFLIGYWWYSLVLPTFSPRDGLQVHFLDVGQGDAILIKTPERNILVDAGRGTKVLSALQEVLPMSSDVIDVTVLTHPDADHIGGFVPVFKRYAVNTIVRSFIDSDTGVYRSVQEEIARAQQDGAAVYVVDRAYTFSLDGARFDILWPLGRDVRETNAASIVVLVTYGDMKILLTGDANSAVEDMLVKAFPERTADVDILKAGHHGSKTSTSDFFLRHVKPNVIVYSASKNNRYGHPHDIVRERVVAYSTAHPEEGLTDFWTAENGTVSFCLTETAFQVCD